MNNTLSQYKEVSALCRDIFDKKNKDYGSAWRILRPSSITDQIFIKAKRIRSIQEKKVNKVGESIEGEFIAMVNYGLMGIIQLNIHHNIEINDHKLKELYDTVSIATQLLYQKKNHDYGEAWKNMRISSIVDLILMKILRIKHIEDNDGKTQISEGIYEGYQDIINYSIFCLILMSEKKSRKSVKNHKPDDK